MANNINHLNFLKNLIKMKCVEITPVQKTISDYTTVSRGLYHYDTSSKEWDTLHFYKIPSKPNVPSSTLSDLIRQGHLKDELQHSFK